MHAIRVTLVVFYCLYALKSMCGWLLLGDPEMKWPLAGQTRKETVVGFLIDFLIAVWLAYLIFKH